MSAGIPPMMAGAAAVAAAAAEAARRREEEEMTSYTPQDHGEWEYKIIRTNGSYFRKPERLHGVLAEEALAGWELVEKFDDSRIRLRRPTSRRQLDGKLDFDPYRTQVGGGVTAVVLVAALLAGLLAFALSMMWLRATPQVAIPAAPAAVFPIPEPLRPEPTPTPEVPGPPSLRPMSVAIPAPGTAPPGP